MVLRKAKCSKRTSGETLKWVERLLQEDRNPEQINLCLAREKQRAGGDLYAHLRYQKPRRKRYGTYDRRGKLPNRKSIEERPAVVVHRSCIGDWKLNTIIGKNHSGVLVSLMERNSRLTLLVKEPDKTAWSVREAILKLLEPVANRVH